MLSARIDACGCSTGAGQGTVLLAGILGERTIWCINPRRVCQPLGLSSPRAGQFINVPRWSVLLYYLAFKFVGIGLHALQVAGVLPATTEPFLPASGLIGLFPTLETTLGQGALLLVVVFLLAFTRLRRLRGGRRHAVAAAA